MLKAVKFLGVLLLLVGVAIGQQHFPGVSGNPSPLSRPGGVFYAPGFFWSGRVITGNSSTGTGSITVAGTVGGAGGLQLIDGTTIPLQAVFSTLTPIVVDYGQAAAETVTPTAVSVGTCTAGNIGIGGSVQCATITATFANTHGQSAVVADGTFGLQTAINYAASFGGGTVTVDNAWQQMGGTNSLIAAAIPFAAVTVSDLRNSTVEYYNVKQTASTFLAAPTTLTAVTALPSAAPVGAYTTGTYFMCISYVDVAGQEGPCSATFSQAGLATGSFIFSAPAASTGAVGYTIYISLTGGTYSLAYQVPLTSTVCSLTRIETVTPACAVANTTYNQSGSTATVTALTVNTSPVDMQLGGVSGTLLTGNPNGRTTYGYVAGSGVGSTGFSNVELAFTVGGIGSATPISIGTVNLPAGFMNQVGKTIRVCGKFLNTDVNSATQVVNLYWDAAGSNVAGSPVKLTQLTATGTGTAAAYEGVFCENLTTSVSGAGTTAGSVIPGWGSLQYALVSTGNIVGNGMDTLAAAVASLNLAGGAGFSTRLSVIHNNTTGNATPQLQSLTLEVL